MSETPERGLFIHAPVSASMPVGSYLRATFALEGSDWVPLRVGDCESSVVFGGEAEVGTWRPAGTTHRSATSIEVWVQERRCASGQAPVDRILAPDIRFGTTAITITFGITPREGDQDCQGVPPVRYLVELPEPIGLRELRDGAFFPATTVRSAPSGVGRAGPYPAAPWTLDRWSGGISHSFAPLADGVTLRDRAINLIVGSAHCEMQSANFIHVGWPFGHEAKDSSEARQYVRDPLGIFGDPWVLEVAYDGAAELPEDARYTALKNGDLELWIMDAELDDAIYLVTGDGAERWPRANMIGCASADGGRRCPRDRGWGAGARRDHRGRRDVRDAAAPAPARPRSRHRPPLRDEADRLALRPPARSGGVQGLGARGPPGDVPPRPRVDPRRSSMPSCVARPAHARRPTRSIRSPTGDHVELSTSRREPGSRW